MRTMTATPEGDSLSRKAEATRSRSQSATIVVGGTYVSDTTIVRFLGDPTRSCTIRPGELVRVTAVQDDQHRGTVVSIVSVTRPNQKATGVSAGHLSNS